MSKTIAIFRTGGIGDVILSTVSLNVIKDQLPDARIIWFGREPTLSLIKSIFTNVEVYEIPAGNTYKENLERIKNSAVKIDAFIDLQHSARTIILARLAARHFKCSYTSWNKYSIERSLLVIQSRLRGRRLSVDLLKNDLPNRFDAMAACTLKALNKIGIKITSNKNYTPAFNTRIEKRTNEAITICLGAKFLTKTLPTNTIETLIEQLILQQNIKTIYLLGDENQKNNADQLIKKFDAQLNLVNLCGLTTLIEAANVLQQSKYAITNDSGLAHLSEAVDTPVLMFFGPTHQKFGYRPHLKKSKTLSVELGCRPCNKNGDVKCRYNDHACSALSLAEIKQQITQMQNA